jgi:hypothetical protein
LAWHLCSFFLSTLSHPLLDAMTDGGLRNAFFSPFSNRRYFFPVSPIAVPPIGIRVFFETRLAGHEKRSLLDLAAVDRLIRLGEDADHLARS